MQLKDVLQISRLDKPRGVILLFWPTLGALLITSNGYPETGYLLLFSLGVILTRSLGCVINDIADRDIDQSVQRTKDRPLATGAISVNQASLVFMTFLVFAAACWLYLNVYAKAAAVMALVLAVLYPFTKRFFFALS